MPRTYSSIDKIRAELTWVNETPDPNKCGCRNLRCCEETGHKPGECSGTVATMFWTFRWGVLLVELLISLLLVMDVSGDRRRFSLTSRVRCLIAVWPRFGPWYLWQAGRLGSEERGSTRQSVRESYLDTRLSVASDSRLRAPSWPLVCRSTHRQYRDGTRPGHSALQKEEPHRSVSHPGSCLK